MFWKGCFKNFQFFNFQTLDALAIIERYKHMKCPFHSYWKLEGALVQKRPMCITEVIELMTLQEISNMDKGIQLLLWLNKKKI